MLTCSRDFDGPEIEARDLSELLQQGHCVMFWGYANKLTCLSNHIGPFYEVKQSKTSRQMIALDPETRVRAYLGTVRRRPKDKKFLLDHVVKAQLVVGESRHDVSLDMRGMQCTWSDGRVTGIKEHYFDRNKLRIPEPPSGMTTSCPC